MESIERIPRGSIQSVRASALKQMIAERKDLLLVDVRSEQSYREGHIEGAVNFPLYRLSRSYAEIPLDRTLVLIDDQGFRTFLAGSYMEMKGYRVMRLFGGMQSWQEMLAAK
jgi:rhodanese-related sulfurtransferase